MKKKYINDYLTTILESELNDWEIDELAEKLARFSPNVQKVILQNIPVIWPVSYALFYSFVDQASKAMGCLDTTQLTSWIHAVLDVYESQGLHHAQTYMENVEQTFLCQIKGETGVKFEEVAPWLRPYAIGLAEKNIDIEPSDSVFTDTNSLFLPHEITAFSDNTLNTLQYKLTVTFLTCTITQGTFTGSNFQGEKSTHLDTFFDVFPDKSLGQAIFFSLEGIRLIGIMREYYPGLTRDCQPIFSFYRSQYKKNSGLLSRLYESILSLGRDGESQPVLHGFSDSLQSTIAHHGAVNSGAQSSLELTQKVYKDITANGAGPSHGVTPPPFMGELKIDRAYEGIMKRRLQAKNAFIESLAAALISHRKRDQHIQEPPQKSPSESSHLYEGDGQALIIEAEKKDTADAEVLYELGEYQSFITIDNESLSITEDCNNLLKEIVRDLSSLPGEYVSSAVGLASGGLATLAEIEDNRLEDEISGPILYDEWDFRRKGFRKNWCSLKLKYIQPTKGTFIDTTLNKHRGTLVNLRRQFELMRVEHCSLRRQRDGDDIDVDALVESINDRKAGITPSDNVFIRQQRAKRSIAALFLVDMSSSTEGWVSTSIKEALVLMCEALDILGDRYAIYGFSGMRRSRSEYFVIKNFNDAYTRQIKEKITAISPKEYTRMGPAIRHASTILETVEAKVRLLITLSDGKPEDYDDYKGRYAIEDTRHALIEAKSAGIHPFCITVDKFSQDYMAHMYGEVNYVFINNIARLPQKIPEIYRNLTT